MASSNTATIQTEGSAPAGTTPGFTLDVSLVEVTDAKGLVAATDDGCGSTCGACTTNVA